MRFSELCEKEVINISDCRCIGNVADIELDECSGCICSLIVPECVHFFGLFGPNIEYIIPWSRIVRIGPDIILVDVCLKDIKVKRGC